MYQSADFTEIAQGERSMQPVIFLFEVLMYIIAIYFLSTPGKLSSFSYR